MTLTGSLTTQRRMTGDFGTQSTRFTAWGQVAAKIYEEIYENCE
jgi:hypothetical protein